MNILDEIVFNNKNKSYGAYQIRKRYNKSLSYGLLFALIIFLSITVFAYYESPNTNDFANIELQQEIVEYEQYNLLKNIDSLLVYSPPPKKQIAKKDNKIMLIVDSIKPKSDTIKIVKYIDQEKDTLKNDSIALLSDSSKAGSVNGTNNGAIYTRVDELPEFPGGFGALRQYLLLNTHYPEDARKANIKGMVQIQFVITKYGDIDKVTIKQGVNTLLANEAMRVVKSFPKWKPARRKGKAVSVWCVIPFNYQL
jgi:protein TonB